MGKTPVAKTRTRAFKEYFKGCKFQKGFRAPEILFQVVVEQELLWERLQWG